jgi:hypothetical protein
MHSLTCAILTNNSSDAIISCSGSHLIITINTEIQTMETNPKMITLVQCEFNESSSFLEDFFLNILLQDVMLDCPLVTIYGSMLSSSVVSKLNICIM